MMLEIVDWGKHFENNRTRDMKHLRWLPMPNKHDGEGYTELMCEGDSGPEDYAAWCLIAQVASKCEPRGKLVKDDGSAMTPQSLARKTRAPARIFEHAIPRLVSIGWLKDTGAGAGIPQGGARGAQDPAQKGTEGKGTEEKGKTFCPEPDKSASAPPVFELTLSGGLEHYGIDQQTFDKWTNTYPGVDVMTELHKAEAWCDANPTRRKTKRGAKRFLNGWLSRSQDRSRGKGEPRPEMPQMDWDRLDREEREKNYGFNAKGQKIDADGNLLEVDA